MKPTFIGIGAQKCASTWLYRILAEHPQVGVSADKELDFFSYRYDRGFQWYERHFDGCAGKLAFGEISPSYFAEPAVPERVSRYAPNVKVLVSFRDPIQRALSNHKHEVRLGQFNGSDLSFEAGLRNNPMYVEQGRYATHLANWLTYFPREQILCVFMDDVENDPGRVAADVYAFLGIDPSYLPAGVTTKFNPSYANRYRWLLGIKDVAYKLTQLPGGAQLWKLAQRLGLRDAYRSVNRVESQQAIPRAQASTIEALRQEFRDEVKRLEQLVGRDLSNWLR